MQAVKTHEKLALLARSYSTGDFTDIRSNLDEKCTFETDWRTDMETGRKEVTAYFQRKGAILKKYQVMPQVQFVKVFYRAHHVGEEALYLQQVLEGKIFDAVLMMKINTAGKIVEIALKMKELFRMICWAEEIAY